MKKPEDIRISPKKKVTTQNASKAKPYEASSKSHPAPPPPSSVMRESSVKKYSIKKRNDGGVYVETKYLHSVNKNTREGSLKLNLRMAQVAKTRLAISARQTGSLRPRCKAKCKKKTLPSGNARSVLTTFQTYPFTNFKSMLRHTSKMIPRISSN